MDAYTTQEEMQQAYEVMYKEAIRLKAKMGMERKAAKGILHGCAPLGYKNTVVNGEKVIVIDPEKAPKVRRLFELSRKRGMTIRKLVPIAAEMGLKSRNGKALGASSVHLILTNPFYTGYVTYGKEIINGGHEGLITVKFSEEIAAKFTRLKS